MNQIAQVSGTETVVLTQVSYLFILMLTSIK